MASCEFQAETADLDRFVGLLRHLSDALESARCRASGTADTGSRRVNDAITGFHSHWSNEMKIVGGDLADIAEKVDAAVTAYVAADGDIANAASASISSASTI